MTRGRERAQRMASTNKNTTQRQAPTDTIHVNIGSVPLIKRRTPLSGAEGWSCFIYCWLICFRNGVFFCRLCHCFIAHPTACFTYQCCADERASERARTSMVVWTGMSAPHSMGHFEFNFYLLSKQWHYLQGWRLLPWQHVTRIHKIRKIKCLLPFRYFKCVCCWFAHTSWRVAEWRYDNVFGCLVRVCVYEWVCVHNCIFHIVSSELQMFLEFNLNTCNKIFCAITGQPA